MYIKNTKIKLLIKEDLLKTDFTIIHKYKRWLYDNEKKFVGFSWYGKKHPFAIFLSNELNCKVYVSSLGILCIRKGKVFRVFGMTNYLQTVITKTATAYSFGYRYTGEEVLLHL